MALRNRAINLNVANQENVKNVKSMAIVSGQTRRAALGEIGNRVIVNRANELTGKTSQTAKDKVLQKKPVLSKQTQVKVDKLEKVVHKVQVQIIKPVVKAEIQVDNRPLPEANKNETDSNANKKETETSNEVKKEADSFSSDLITIEDIDEEDRKNPILVSVYSNDIYAHLRDLEMQFPVKKGYLQGQEVTPKMRCVLVDWLIEVHEQFHLMQETLYMTIAIIDRFLQDFRLITRKRLQLVGVTAMFIASKYEEMYSPDISDFVYITDNAYTKSEILQMEMIIIKTLEFSFGKPLPLHFLRRYSKAGKALPVHHTLAKYFLEQCLVHYEVCHHPPSLIAAGAIYLSFLLLGNDNLQEGDVIWTKTLVHYSTYRTKDVLPVVQEISAIMVNAEKSKYQAARRKYTNSKHMKISLRPELKSPTLVALVNHKN
ncbi:PREDICTED: G2/mitotic-specific cyclin-B [Ceratosolen solmsi marchali]|uniref:G2/mitotic-specific cyclin-B n=1 Tax=Ceratosolen solmsi marchali TaxID=326594 RepID=A0AAJ6VKB2_9HYME|nr:PREDICTED: G2/mitotic-specific cyclin-B [Ceratosolen solmsi marchali]